MIEFGTALVLGLACCFIAILGVKVSQNYFRTEDHRITETLKKEHTNEINDLTLKLHNARNKHAQAVHTNAAIRNNYELGYNDVDIEEDQSDELKLSDLATSIYPKLPPSLLKILDKEEFQNAIIKTVEKKPEILNTFLDKFIPKSSAGEGSTSNSSTKLVETYL